MGLAYYQKFESADAYTAALSEFANSQTQEDMMLETSDFNTFMSWSSSEIGSQSYSQAFMSSEMEPIYYAAIMTDTTAIEDQATFEMFGMTFAFNGKLFTAAEQTTYSDSISDEKKEEYAKVTAEIKAEKEKDADADADSASSLAMGIAAASVTASLLI